MGSQVSKPGRNLAKSVSESAKPVLNRSTNINQLPSQALKEQYERHEIEKNIKQFEKEKDNKDDGVVTPDASLESNKSNFRQESNAKLDPSFLKKKIKNSPVVAEPKKENITAPEGRDGFDPQADQDFIRSINNLGKQIHSYTPTAIGNENSMAIKQLNSRKVLYEKGQKELELQKNQHSDGNSSTDFVRTMVHPRTLGAIISDIHDQRINEERILADFQLEPSFLKDLGKRFKVATRTVILEEKPKSDEIGHVQNAPGKSMMDYNDEEVGEKLNPEKLQKLKSRISLED